MSKRTRRRPSPYCRRCSPPWSTCFRSKGGPSRSPVAVARCRSGWQLEAWRCSVSTSPPVAMDVARELASRSGVSDRCRFEVWDLDQGLPPGPPVDVVVCSHVPGTPLASRIDRTTGAGWPARRRQSERSGCRPRSLPCPAGGIEQSLRRTRGHCRSGGRRDGLALGTQTGLIETRGGDSACIATPLTTITPGRNSCPRGHEGTARSTHSASAFSDGRSRPADQPPVSAGHPSNRPVGTSATAEAPETRLWRETIPTEPPGPG